MTESTPIPKERGWLFCYNRLRDCGGSRILRNAFHDIKDAVNDARTQETLPAWIAEPVAWISEEVISDVNTLSLWMQHDYWAISRTDRPGAWPDQPEVTVLATRNRLRSITAGDLARDPDGNWWIAAAIGWARIEITED